MKKIFLIFLLTFSLVLFGCNKQQEAPKDTAEKSPEEVVADEKPVVSKKPSVVSMIEYSDFQCPYCQKVQPTIEKLKEKYGEELSFEKKNMVIKRGSRQLAIASECSKLQNVQEEFDKQIWGDYFHRIGIEAITEIAGKINMPEKESFLTCVRNEETGSLVDNQGKEAQKAGANGTPFFVIGDQTLSGNQSFEKFSEMIDKQLQ